MSFLDYLREQRTSATSIWQQFILSYDEKSKELYIFFEGVEDRCFYLPEIRRLYNGRGGVTCYVCGGKVGVIDTYFKIRNKVRNKRRILFFVDKDHDDLIGSKGIKLPKSNSFYQTEFYSIENYIVCCDVVKSIWSYIWKFDENDRGLEELCKLFSTYTKTYSRSMLCLTSWILYHRRKGNKAVLANLNLNKYVKVTDTYNIKMSNKLVKKLDKTCQVITSDNVWKSIRSISKEINTDTPKVYLRGKFELWFFVKFLSVTLKNLKSSIGSNVQKPAVHTNITHANAVEILSQYVTLPKEFYNFINYNISRI